MNPRHQRLSFVYLYLALGCAFVLIVAGCDDPPGTREIKVINGQVATESNVEIDRSDWQLDNGTPLTETLPATEDTWASPDGEIDNDVELDDTENTPVKPTFQSNAGTGSSDTE